MTILGLLAIQLNRDCKARVNMVEMFRFHGVSPITFNQGLR